MNLDDYRRGGSLWLSGNSLDPEDRWDRRDKKKRKRRFGMVVDGAGAKVLARLLPKKKHSHRG